MSEETTKVTKKEEEGSSKKREWIKNIAIIFLAVMLVLTFFSNTIMNYSLPQVSTEAITSGSIKNQVRGKGIIELVDPYNVTVNETRTISSVHVSEGDYVEIGDVIYSLKGEESEELEEAKAELKAAETEYLKNVLAGNYTPNAGTDIDLAAIQKALAALDATIQNAENNKVAHENLKAEYERQLKALGEYNNDTSELSKQVAAAQLDVDNKQAAVDSIRTKYKNTYGGEIDENYIALKAAYDAAIEAGNTPSDEEKMGNEYAQALDKLAKANKTLAEKKYNLEVAGYNTDPNAGKKKELNNAIANEEYQILIWEKALKDAEDNKSEYVAEMTGKIDAAAATEKINALQEKIAKLEKDALGSEITAPVAGKIVMVGKTAGESTEPKETVCTIQVEGKGYRTSISVEARAAATVRVGDTVTIEDYYLWGVTANLVAIQPDKDDPKNKKLLVFDLLGEDLVPGASISLSVGDMNSNYNLTVPKSALHQDNKGDYILILESKAVPFGTRYLTKRVDVTQIYATDDFRAAIEANVEPWGVYAITNSTRPLKSGEQVRLAEEAK